MALTLEAPTKPKSTKVTLRTLRRWAELGEPFAMLTCYDATTAKWLWRGGIRCMLVGDTAAQVILGYDSTLPVSMPFMLEITGAVRRGAPDAFVMADMPFGSYQCGEDEAVRNAVAFLKEAGADAVKLEVDASHARLVGRLGSAGVPVVAHMGLRPQQVRAQGGYLAAGQTRDQAASLLEQAQLFLQQGAAMLLLEAVPDQLSQEVVAVANSSSAGAIVPVIGCGAGNSCHGHVVVLQDLLGMTDWQPPFAPPMADLGEQVRETAAKWAGLVSSCQYLQHDHPYKMRT